MVQKVRLCFGTSLRKLWGSCLGGDQPKQNVRREGEGRLFDPISNGLAQTYKV